jgi:2'-5' RNA ligase
VAGRAPPYQAKWDLFSRLQQTQDSLEIERRGLRRWLLLPYIAFIIPIDDPLVVAQIARWQDAFRSWLPYDPQPLDRLHVTLHYVGFIRPRPWLLLPNTWRRVALPWLAAHAARRLAQYKAFHIGIGPLNAFANVLFAEIQDDNDCLRTLRARIRRSLPLRARPATQWSYLPHVTLGYWGEQPAAPLIEALRSYRTVEPLTFRVDSVRLTIYTRQPFTSPDMLGKAQEEMIAEFHLK